MEGSGQVIRVLIVDDHTVVRSGLRALLADEDGIEVVGEASDAAGAVARALTLRPDVVILDVRLGAGVDAGGVAACRDIRADLPDTRVIMFSSFSERETVLDSIIAGANGFLTKNVSAERLIEAIRTAAGGGSILDPSVTRDVISRLVQMAEAPKHHDEDLSEREREVLSLMARGYTNKEIANALVISPFTARNHVTRILEKLGVSRRSEAAAMAVRRGLIADGDE